MPAERFHRSREDRWTAPRPYSDASLRRRMHGAIQPMEKPTIADRIARIRLCLRRRKRR